MLANTQRSIQLVFLSIFFLLTASVTTAQNLPDISVEGTADFISAPTQFLVEADFSLSAREAAQTSSALADRIKTTTNALEKITPPVTITQGSLILSGPQGEAISKNSILMARQRIKVRSSTREQLISVVDILRNSEAELISPVLFEYDSYGAQYLEAQSKAISNAMSRATAAAKELGVTLGSIKQTSISEVPLNAVIYKPQSQGIAQNLSLGRPQQKRIAVSLRIAIAEASSQK